MKVLAANILFMLIVIGLSSCTSMKWKNNYFETRFKTLKEYSNDGTIYASLPSELGLKKSIKRTSKKRLIAIMDKLEMGTALFPDSVSTNNGKIDSFYRNPQKIEFIRAKKLISERIFFIEVK